MRKNHLFQLLALFVGCFALFSCTSEEPNNGGGTYTPPANLTNEQIVQLLQEAATATGKETKVTVTHVRTTDVPNVTYQTRSAKGEFDLVAKKYLALNINDEVLIGLTYVEGDSKYDYEYNDPKKTYIARYADDFFWESINVSTTPIVVSVFKWIVKDGKLVGTYESSKENVVTTVTLDGNKRFQTFNIVETNVADKTTIRNDAITYQYNANPQLPSGFTKSQFESNRIKQYSLNVNWGAGNKTLKYWSGAVNESDNSANFEIHEGIAPAVAGKVPEFYTDQALANKITSVSYYSYGSSYSWNFNYQLTEATKGATIYAKWVDPSTVINLSSAPVKAPANVEENGFFGAGEKLF